MGGLGEGGDARVEPFLEHVARGDVLRVLVPQEEIRDLGAAAAAADEGEPHAVVGALHARPRARRSRRQHGQSCGRSEKIPPREVFACPHTLVSLFKQAVPSM